jgi:hypothetical protein
MGLRGRPLSQHGRRPRAVATRWALAVTALVTVTMLGLTPAALANAGSETSWWDDHPRPQPPTSVTHETGWLDVLDLGASVRAGSQTGIGAGVTLRVRLDAKAHLARLRAEAEDLAAITAALARHRDLGAALAWLAGRCLGHWRAWQLQLLDALLQTGTAGGGHDLDHAYLGALRDLHALDATRPAGAADVRACRLTEPLASLAFAADHPQVVSAAAERSLGERTQALMAAPAPPSLWFSADGRAGGGRGLVVDVRFGLDVPLAAGAAAVDVTLASDGGGAYHARLGFQRAGAASRQPVRAGAGRYREARTGTPRRGRAAPVRGAAAAARGGPRVARRVRRDRRRGDRDLPHVVAERRSARARWAQDDRGGAGGSARGTGGDRRRRWRPGRAARRAVARGGSARGTLTACSSSAPASVA